MLGSVVIPVRGRLLPADGWAGDDDTALCGGDAEIFALSEQYFTQLHARIKPYII